MIQAILKYAKISPKKLTDITFTVKKMRLNDALNWLTFNNKSGSKILYQVLKSAVANAKNKLKLTPDNIYIKKIEVSAGPVYKRWRAVSRGQAHGYKKRTSHIRVVLDQIKSKAIVKEDNGSKD